MKERFLKHLPDQGYELIRIIGRGSYGEVWLARGISGDYRACKIVQRAKFDHERPYKREYSGIKNFQPISRANDHQVKILHVESRDDEGFFYYVMELADDVVTGQTIDANSYVAKTIKTELKQKGRLPVEESVRIGLSLATALGHLHENGFIHRDVKPSNIIFVNDVPKLADIGLLTESKLTVSYVGTEGFIPPEGPTSPQADIYSLGKVLYEMTTGRDRLDFPELPLDFEDLPDRVALLELNAIVSKACETDVRKRYQSAKEMASDLLLLSCGKSVMQGRSANQRRAIILKFVLPLILIGLLAVPIIFPRKPFGETPTPSQLSPRVPAISPPIVSPLNNHTYILLDNATWTDSEAEAISLGGHLTTIRNQQEQQWVFETFGFYAGTNRLLWIGLNDAETEGEYVWASGEQVAFRNWSDESPNNSKGNEHYVSMYDPVNPKQENVGKWNDWSNRLRSPFRKPFNGVVEIISHSEHLSSK